MSRIAVFLDRDGTINEDPGYLHQPEQLRLFPGAARAIASLNGYGVPVVLVTNQSGIARGYYDEEQFWRVQERMVALLAAEGAHLDAVYLCPHHPDGLVEAYRVACHCRKPAPGMLQQAARELDLDLRRSYMIGDKLSDVEAGAAVGCRTVLVTGGEVGGVPGSLQADYVADSLSTGIAWVLAQLRVDTACR